MLRGIGLPGVLAWALLAGPCWAAAEEAPGSWQGRAPALLVARSDRPVCSAPMPPPPLAGGRRLTALGWQFGLPAGAPVRAWLCHPQRCVALPGERGRSRALAGLDAGQPLQLCFRRETAGPSVRVGDLRLLVEYR